MDTRKDIAKLIPNLEKELNNLREILAQQMVLFEVINTNIDKLATEVKNQGKKISNIEKTSGELEKSGLSEVELTDESKKAIAKLMKDELKDGTKPLTDSLKILEKEIDKAGTDTLKKVEKQLATILDQIDDLSSKSELQMLEILESVNQSPMKSQSKSSSKSTTKKKLTS
ncbi:MAG: hypothetical protein FK731_12360 [Asgard group archaeon]|nr:hypothetical protein [Asgard group archaeon]